MSDFGRILDRSMDFLCELSFRMSVEEFMKKLLRIALNIVPGYNKGSVVMKRGGKWEYIAWEGFPDDISRIEIDGEYMFIPSGEDPLIITDIFQRNQEIFPKEIVDMYRKIGTPNIKSTISVGIKVDNEIIGGFFFDSEQEVKDISQEYLKAIKSFGKLASVFTAMKLYQERERGYQKEIIMAMIKVMEARDPYTVGHSERVAKYAVAIAKAMGLDMKDADRIYWGSIVHDIGKVSIPEYILLKPFRLSPEEYEIVRRHPIIGEEMIRDYPWLEGIRKIVRNHHERWDGKGYPDGLKARSIPVEVRIVTLADAFDAMTSDRAYKKALKMEDALEEVKKQAGKQFDPEIAKIGLEILEHKYVDVRRNRLPKYELFL